MTNICLVKNYLFGFFISLGEMEASGEVGPYIACPLLDCQHLELAHSSCLENVCWAREDLCGRSFLLCVRSTWWSPPLLCLSLVPASPTSGTPDPAFLYHVAALFHEETSWPCTGPGTQSVPRKCLMNPGPLDPAFRGCKIKMLTFLPEKCRFEGRCPFLKRFHSIFPLWRGTNTAFG